MILEEWEIVGENQSPEDEYEGVDEVIVEDVTDEESEKYTTENDDLPSFADLFGRHTEEELNRKLHEKESISGASSSTPQTDEDLRKKWIDSYREILRSQKEKPTAAYRKLYKIKGHRTKGQIIS